MSERATREREGFHGHVHEHSGIPHRHEHHHRGREGHAHTHTLAFERYAYLDSPLHRLDPRAKLVGALVIVVGVVASPPARPVEYGALVVLLLALTVIAGVPLRALLGRSALVLPVAGGIALFAPLAASTGLGLDAFAEAYRQGWPLAWSIVSKAWLSAYLVLLVSATTSPPRLFAGMRKLGMPLVFVTMLTFLYRFSAALGEQLASMRRSLASRGFGLKGRQLIALYGNLAGNLFIRAYERGERVYASMVSRGYDGTLPVTEPLRARPADALLVTTSLLVAFAVVLY